MRVVPPEQPRRNLRLRVTRVDSVAHIRFDPRNEWEKADVGRDVFGLDDWHTKQTVGKADKR